MRSRRSDPDATGATGGSSSSSGDQSRPDPLADLFGTAPDAPRTDAARDDLDDLFGPSGSASGDDGSSSIAALFGGVDSDGGAEPEPAEDWLEVMERQQAEGGTGGRRRSSWTPPPEPVDRGDAEEPALPEPVAAAVPTAPVEEPVVDAPVEEPAGPVIPEPAVEEPAAPVAAVPAVAEPCAEPATVAFSADEVPADEVPAAEVPDAAPTRPLDAEPAKPADDDPFAGLFADTGPVDEAAVAAAAGPTAREARAAAKAEARAAKEQARADAAAAKERARVEASIATQTPRTVPTVTDASPAAAGEFAPAPRRGIATWGPRAWWSIAAAIALVAVLVGGTVVIAQTTAANARVAEALAVYDADVAAATAPQERLDAAVTAYDRAVIDAQAAADSAAPALAAVEGMTDPVPLEAARAELAALVAALADQQPPAVPEPFAAPDFTGAGTSDIPAITAAGAEARDAALEAQRAVAQYLDAAAALETRVAALLSAEKALGTSLPATAATIIEENPLAEQSFRDAVVATAAAVGTAQTAGGSGDAELLAYAAAVTALRADQERAAEEARQAPPPVAPQPQPQPQPQPEPEPEPTTPPAPSPSPTPTPPPPPPDPEPTP